MCDRFCKMLQRRKSPRTNLPVLIVVLHIAREVDAAEIHKLHACNVLMNHQPLRRVAGEHKEPKLENPGVRRSKGKASDIGLEWFSKAECS